MSTALAPVAVGPLEFKAVRHNPDRVAIVTLVFQHVLAPIYGDQTAALKKIMAAEDRTCRMLYEGEEPRGIVVYKDQPSQECAQRGIRNSFEIKTLCLLDPCNQSGKGLGKALLQHCIETAKKVEAAAIHVTVNDTKPESLSFFQKNGFQVLEKKPGHIGTEYVLQKRLKEEAPARFTEATLKEPYLSQIRDGRKTVEGRISSGMFGNVKSGDRFAFFNHSGRVTCHVTEAVRYGSFREMLEKEGFQKCIPNARNLEDAVRQYEVIPGYVERARQSGVVALRLAVEEAGGRKRERDAN